MPDPDTYNLLRYAAATMGDLTMLDDAPADAQLAATYARSSRREADDVTP